MDGAIPTDVSQMYAHSGRCIQTCLPCLFWPELRAYVVSSPLGGYQPRAFWAATVCLHIVSIPCIFHGARRDQLAVKLFFEESKGWVVGVRHELQLRVSRYKYDPDPFRPFGNATLDLRTCVHCGKMAPKMRRCCGCRWAKHCDREYQKANWRTHRTRCCLDHTLPAGIRTIPYPYQYEAQASRSSIGFVFV